MQTLEELHAHYQAVRARINNAAFKSKEPIIRLVYPEPKPEPEPAPAVETPKQTVRQPFEVYATPAQRIIFEVAQKHGMKVKDVTGHSRLGKIISARHEACYRLREELGYSLTQIGRVVGKRDHTTVLNAINRHKKNLAKSEELQARQVVSDGCAEETEAHPS